MVEPSSNWLFVGVLSGQDFKWRRDIHFFDELFSVKNLLLVEDLFRENELLVSWRLLSLGFLLVDIEAIRSCELFDVIELFLLLLSKPFLLSFIVILVLRVGVVRVFALLFIA